MRLLIVSHFLPFPLLAGGQTRLFNLLKDLCIDNEVEFIHLAFDSDENVELSRKAFPSIVFKQINCGIGYNFFVYYFLSLFGLGGLAISPVVKKFIAREVKDFSPDYVQFEFSQSARFFPGNFDNSVLVVHELRWIRMSREARRPVGIRGLIKKIGAQVMKREELNSFKRFKKLVCVSEDDKIILEHCFPKKSVITIPNGVDLAVCSFQPVLPTEEKKIFFIGWFGNKQNCDALDFLISHIVPRLSANIKVNIFGEALPESLMLKVKSSGCKYFGYVPSDELAKKVQNSILVLPLFSGGGTRLKVLEALSRGNPVVSSRIGVEGIEVENMKNVVICESPEQFADGIKRLLSDDFFWSKLSNNGRALVEEKYGWNMICVKNRKVYE